MVLVLVSYNHPALLATSVTVGVPRTDFRLSTNFGTQVTKSVKYKSTDVHYVKFKTII